MQLLATIELPPRLAKSAEGSKSLSVAVLGEYFSGLEVMDDATMEVFSLS
jgi:hypothetical protein